MIIEKITELCLQNGTTLTALCKEITGSSGNLPTWKKDNIKISWLRDICLKFNISSDELLALKFKTYHSPIEYELLEIFHQLSLDEKKECIAYFKGYLAHSKKISEENDTRKKA